MCTGNRILPDQPAVPADHSKLQLRLTDGNDPRLREFVEARYQQVHGAHVRQLLPVQLALYHGLELVAVIGLRPAEAERLFLEHYLNAPIERLLSAQLGAPVVRREVVEVGNMVAASGWGRMAILSATAYLAGQIFRYVAFTATRTLRSGFQRLGMQPRLLAPAPASAVPDQAQWGGYYQQSPCVMWGAIQTGWELVCARPNLSAALAQVNMPASGSGVGGEPWS